MNRSLRVLHVQHSLEPGGMENGVVNLAQALHPKGIEFHVACLSSSGGFADRLPDPGLVYALNKPEGFSPRCIARLSRLVHRVDPDVIHSHNLGGLIYSACATVFGRTRPILHGEHGTPDDGPAGGRRSRQRRFFFQAARKVHTVSHSLLTHFLDQGFPASRLTALVNGVDTSRFSPGDRHQSRQALSIPPEATVLLMVGRLIASKQHRLLFDAMEHVVASHPDALLVVLGDGGRDQDAVREAARTSRVSQHIRMEGFIADPVGYYRASDLLVSPSQVEGLSNVVLEAMACGLPTLLHDACGNRDVIDHEVDGVVTALDCSDKLAGAINHLLADPPRLAAYGQRARDKVLAKFTLQQMATAYENTYRELAGARR